MSYQVILTEGPDEPWWFFDDWQDNITWQQICKDLKTARQFYRSKYRELATKYQYLAEKNNYQVAFWNEGEIYYCDDCDDDLQLYHGLLITKDYEPIE